MLLTLPPSRTCATPSPLRHILSKALWHHRALFLGHAKENFFYFCVRNPVAHTKVKLIMSYVRSPFLALHQYSSTSSPSLSHFPTLYGSELKSRHLASDLVPSVTPGYIDLVWCWLSIFYLIWKNQLPLSGSIKEKSSVAVHFPFAMPFILIPLP